MFFLIVIFHPRSHKVYGGLVFLCLFFVDYGMGLVDDWI